MKSSASEPSLRYIRPCFFYASVAQKCLGYSNYYNRLFEKNTNSFSMFSNSFFFYTHCRSQSPLGHGSLQY